MSSHFLKTYEPFHTKTGAHVWDITLTFSVLQRVNPLTHFLLALLPRLSRFQVDPDGESDEWRMMELVVSEEAQPWFMGVVELDLGDLPFGVTQAWFPLKDSRKWRGPELNPRNRLRLGHIRPMAPIQRRHALCPLLAGVVVCTQSAVPGADVPAPLAPQGELYLTMTATNPVMHLPAPPPKSGKELFSRERVGEVLERSRGLGKRRRGVVLEQMWAELERDERAAAAAYEGRAAELNAEHQVRCAKRGQKRGRARGRKARRRRRKEQQERKEKGERRDEREKKRKKGEEK
eukprot:2759857-Rhodomonas_salina.1